MEFYNKDVQILRQSQIKIVLELLTLHNIKPSVMELQRMTDIFVECGLRSMDKDLKDKVKKLDEWIETKIKENN